MQLAVFLFLFSPLSFAQDPAWLALLHSSGGASSVKQGSPFFLSPTGHRDPAAELVATKEYFAKNPEEAACRFPARAIYLGLSKEGSGDLCERWQTWRGAINATGAELVFAAAFLSSPSSMYGHTLLKFTRGGKTAGEDLLDYTLNYGARTRSVVGLPYVWKGLTGGFDGTYSTAPFYLKVKEYNYVENRDFWIYPLKLTAEQVRLLVAHSWEIREVEFPYFFLRRNCSFYLLELLEVLKPGSNLTKPFPFWAVPLDTIRVLSKGDWLGTPRYRASRYRRLKELRAQLASDEFELVETLAETGDGELPSGREALVLDAGYELLRYRGEGRSSSGVAEARLNQRRAELGESWAPNYSEERAPELGHPSSRLALGYGQNRRQGFTELQYRGTLHDLLANPHGYEHYSELSMGDLRVRLEAGKVFLERADILRLRSLAPSERWIPRSAWSFRIGTGRAKEMPGCEAWECFRYGLDGGYGASLMIGPVLAFALIDTKVEGGSVFDRGWRW